MTMVDKLDGAFAIIKARPARVIGVAAVVMVPADFLAAFLIRGNANIFETLSALGEVGTTGTTTRAAGTGATDIVMSVLALGVRALAYMLLGGALTKLVTSWYVGGDASIGEALGAMVRRSPALLGAFMVLAPLKLFGALCYLPALFFSPVFSVTAPVIMAEGANPITGPQRSWRLTMSRFGSVFVTFVLTAIVDAAVSFALNVLVQGVGSAAPKSFAWVLQGIGTGMVSLIVAPFVVGVAILQYFDLRIRAEGLDLELAAAQVLPVVPVPDASSPPSPGTS